jgi:hypothetical protein
MDGRSVSAEREALKWESYRSNASFSHTCTHKHTLMFISLSHSLTHTFFRSLFRTPLALAHAYLKKSLSILYPPFRCTVLITLSLSHTHTHTHVLTKHTSEWSLSLVTISSLPSIAETVAQSQRSNTIFLSRQSLFARLKNGIAFARFFRKLSSKVLLVIRKTSYELRSYYDQIQLKYQLKLTQKFLGLTIRHITVKMAVISIGFTRVATQQHLKHFIILFLRKGKTLLK